MCEMQIANDNLLFKEENHFLFLMGIMENYWMYHSHIMI